MKVEHSRNNPTQNNESVNAKQSGRANAAQEAKKSEKTTASESDRSTHSGARTEISAKAKEFAAAKAAATEAPDVREDKVSDLKRRIADGSYKIDTESVADRMVDDHLRMSGMN
jgi:negative regulator of flagellin synthesis FlgM